MAVRCACGRGAGGNNAHGDGSPAAKLSKVKGTHQETYYRDQAPGAACARLHQETGGQRKGSLASYGFEAMEIASYTILVNAAKKVGDKETARVCEQILKQEKAMAAWLEKNLPMLTRQYLRLEETPAAVAKH